MGAIFYLLRARYELKCGNLETAQKMIEDGQKNFPSNKNIQPYFFSLKGSVFALQKEFEKAIYNYKNALEIYESRNKKREAAYIKNNIANTFFNLNDFESAYIYAKESFEEAYQLNDTIYFPQFAAILSISEAKTNKLKEAREHAKLAIDQGNKYRTPVAVIVGKYALGDVYSQQNEWSQAKEFYNEVVGLSEQMKLYQYEVYGRIGLLSCNVKLNLFNEAVVQGEKVIKLNEMLNTHYTDYTVYQQLSEAHAALGNYEVAYSYLTKANSMYREYSSIENKKAIQELLVKYEAEKKELKLSKKNLELSRAITLILSLGLLLVLLLVLFIWRRKQTKNKLIQLRLESQRNQLEAFVVGEQRERERIAADIHDGIASTLTGMAIQVQQIKTPEEIIAFSSHLQNIRNEVRLISKNISPFNLKEEGWKTAFERFISTINTPNFSVFFLLDFDENLLNNQKGMVVYRILQIDSKHTKTCRGK